MNPINMTGETIILQLASGLRATLPPHMTKANDSEGAPMIMVVPVHRELYFEIGSTEVMAEDVLNTVDGVPKLKEESIPVLICKDEIELLPPNGVPIIVSPMMRHLFRGRPNTYCVHQDSAILLEGDEERYVYTHLVAI